MEKADVFIISGKSPVGDSGGYPAYAYNLGRMITSLKHPVSLFAVADTASVDKTPYGTVYFSNTRLISLFPMLRHLALAGLPYYAFILYQSMKRVLRESGSRHCIVWGMGPWGLPGVLLKLFPPRGVKVRLMTSYFTSTRHEMLGALRAIRIDDYGIKPKLKYFVVYHVIARLYHLLEQATLAFCDRIVVHYRSSENIIKKYFTFNHKKIIQFPWYVEIFSREGPKGKLAKTYSHPLIVSICRQDPRKGLNFLIRAMRKVITAFPSAQCLIVGSGEFLKSNQKLVSKLHLNDNVSVVGFVPDIRPILHLADIAVIVPLAQGSSALTVLEAMSYGKAIVGSRCDGIPEDIKNNISGLLVPAGNSEELASAILKLCHNPSLRKRLGKGAFREYKKRFGYDVMLNDVKKILVSSPPVVRV